MSRTCDCPGCTDEATYREPVSEAVAEHVENDTLTVCKRHLDPTTDGVERL